MGLRTLMCCLGQLQIDVAAVFDLGDALCNQGAQSTRGEVIFKEEWAISGRERGGLRVVSANAESRTGRSCPFSVHVNLKSIILQFV